MILRALTLAGGVTGAAAFSQFPEFSQQYVQRLGGAVDALGQVVADFDASAAAEGLTRGAALEQMQGTDFIERRRADMERTFERHARLVHDQEALQGMGPFMRAYSIGRTDSELARATWGDFEPALPLNTAGGLFAGAGFLGGAGLIGGLLALLRALIPKRFRRGRRRADPHAEA